MESTKLFVAIPTIDLKVHSGIIESLWPQLDGAYNAFIKGVYPASRARNIAVERFLERPDATHLLFCDADTVPPERAVEYLMKLDKDIASGVTPLIWKGKDGLQTTLSNVWVDGQDTPLPLKDAAFKPGNVVHARAVGASFMLVKRAVFEKIGKPWFFDVWMEDGRYISEDVNFCDMAKEAGFEIVVHPQVRCRHYKEIYL